VKFRIADTFTDSERLLRILDTQRQWLLPFLATVGNGSPPPSRQRRLSA